MTAPPMNGNGGPPPPTPDGMVPVDHDAVINDLMNAIQQCATAGAMQASAAEAKDFGQAALFYAQALVVLDPSVSQGGTPIAHDLALETQRGANAVALEQVRGDNALKQAREVAAAPTPAKRKSVSVRRDQHGRAQSYSVEG